MWQPCLNVLREQAKNAVMVLDRFHVMVKFNKALDEVRAGEARRLEQDGYEPVLKHSRWSLLKRPENLTDQQTVNLSELLKYNLQSVRGYLLREDFQRFWEYRSPTWAKKFLGEWCRRAMRSRIAPHSRSWSARCASTRTCCRIGSSPRGPYPLVLWRVSTTKPN